MLVLRTVKQGRMERQYSKERTGVETLLCYPALTTVPLAPPGALPSVFPKQNKTNNQNKT